ncbi:hypothetical protein K6U06_05345 [Acidiferrimicrobium sp. IK]|uniref:hypothetical protein n=1 Tax=Acidiferrimicrobium sp. IK TaxID=2871700 RepID=UPI0021CAF513|nr:hypothetical protein [Acidiferrimicrobium sp. IK]MCU4183776.1 hypothetical protein [Acidiferrimicrobium sp. IK]
MSSVDPPPQTPEQRLEATAPGYLAHVRRATRALAAPSGSDEVTAWIDALAHLSIPIEVPVASRRPAGRLVKGALGRALATRTAQISEHIVTMGRGLSNLAAALDARTARVEQELRRAEEELAGLRDRVAALEATLEQTRG